MILLKVRALGQNYQQTWRVAQTKANKTNRMAATSTIQTWK
jgi:hypothetical protein